MPEMVEGKKVFTLSEVTSSIQKTLSGRYASSFWVKAEMNKLNHYPHSGHCYPDLVEKSEGKVVAQFKATLWRDDYVRINRAFIKVLSAPLKDGITMLFCARITFDPVYGLALRIIDIDPVFSLGELEREKQESLSKLQEEGILTRNKALPFPLLPKRLAVVSVETSKGYADFQKVLQHNPRQYRFSHVLFPSLLQGDRAVQSIRYQLARIRKVISHFDVVAIIRGGGGDVGLSCFNDYTLAREVALFPIPVITGIGHATNETVVEMVAWRNAITPTELADFLLQCFDDFADPVHNAEEIIANTAGRLLTEARERLRNQSVYLRSIVQHSLLDNRHALDRCSHGVIQQVGATLSHQRQQQTALLVQLSGAARMMHKTRSSELHAVNIAMKKGTASYLRDQHSMVGHLSDAIRHLHPDNILKRGYTLTRINGKIVTSTEGLVAGDLLETAFADGMVSSEVTAVRKTLNTDSLSNQEKNP